MASNDVMRRLAQEIAAFNNHLTRDAVSGTPSNPYYTGPGGLFGVPGLERDVISTRVRPIGIADMLPVRGSVTMNPMYPYLTGFINDNDDNLQPDGVCDDPPDVGHGKSCLQTAQFGKYSYQTRVIEIGRPGQRINRGEFQDLMLVNPPLFENNMGGIVTPSNIEGSGDVGSEVFMRMVELGISFQNKLSKQLYQGNPTNGTNGGYAEFPGLDILIGTGKMDALTATPCPSLDSLMVDFGNKSVDLNGGDNIVNVLSYMMRYLQSLASRTGMSPVRWVIAMREQLFYEMTAVWPCAYMTYRCQPRVTDGTITQMITPSDQIAMRDAMREGRYLRIDGMDFDVVFDDAIVADATAGGCYSSDIYILPFTVRGGAMASLFWEHLDYQQTALQTAQDMRMSTYFWTDGGRYLWHAPPPTNRCVQLRAWVEPRVILRTPHLAARLQNVQYCPLINTREPYPDDDYFVNGGFYGTRAQAPLFSEWFL